jgi:hypothetical protein
MHSTSHKEDIFWCAIATNVLCFWRQVDSTCSIERLCSWWKCAHMYVVTFYLQSRVAGMYKIHPGFTTTKRGLHKNDLALVFAATPFDLASSYKIQTIALPPPVHLPGESLSLEFQCVSFKISSLTTQCLCRKCSSNLELDHIGSSATICIKTWTRVSKKLQLEIV